MKRGIFYVGTILVLLSLPSCYEISAQRKLIANDERSNIETAAVEKSQKLSRSSKSLRETFVNGVVVKSTEAYLEGTFDGKAHTQIKTTEGGNVDDSEFIIINDIHYYRDSNGAWKRSAEKPFRQIMVGSQLSRPPAGSQYSVEAVSLNGIQMQLLDSFLVNKTDNELFFQHRQLWIGDDGLVYREESDHGRLFPKTVTYRSLTTYEYDPNIKIEAPIK